MRHLFIAALGCISIIAHAHAAETKAITPEMIEEMYKYESKYPGSTLECYQAGQKVLIEPALQDLSINDDGMNAKRLDGSHFTLKTFKGGGDMFCTIITRAEHQ